MFKSFAKNEKGSMLIMTAAGMTAFAAIVGAVIEWSDVSNTGTKMQGDLDHTTLAALANLYNEDGERVGDVESTIDTMFQGNSGHGRVVGWEETITDDKICLTANIEFTKEALITSFVGIEQFDLERSTTVCGTIKKRPVGLTITPLSAKGCWNKNMNLLVDGEAVWSEEYRESGCAGPLPNAGKEIEVEFKDAREVYFTMEVLNTGVTYRSDNPRGTLKFGAEVVKDGFDFFTDIECDTEETYGWEDGADGDYRDFFFKATGKCGDEINEVTDIYIAS